MEVEYDRNLTTLALCLKQYKPRQNDAPCVLYRNGPSHLYRAIPKNGEREKV